MKISNLILSVSLLSLFSGAVQAQSLNYYCKAIIATASAEGAVDMVASRKFVLSELQLNYKISFSEKKLWDVKKGDLRSQSLSGTLLESGFELDVLLSGKQDGEKFINTNITLYPAGRGASEVVKSNNTNKSVVQEAGVFSNSQYVTLEGQDGTKTDVSFNLSCSNSLRLIDAL